MYGDIHVRFLEQEIHELIKQFGAFYNPGWQVFHDVHDHHIGSHHHEKDVLFALQKNANQEFSIRDELQLSIDFLKDKENIALIRSNHHEHLDTWFNKFNHFQYTISQFF